MSNAEMDQLLLNIIQRRMDNTGESWHDAALYVQEKINERIAQKQQENN